MIDRQPSSGRPRSVCVCQWEHWECRRPCAQSGRQSKNARLNREISWNGHSLTDCTQNNLWRSPAHLWQTTSRTAAVWNQSLRPTDSLQAAAIRGTVWLHMVRDEKCLPSNHHSTRRTIGFMHQLITGSNTPIPAVCYACRLWCPLPCHKWVWLNWYLSILGWRWTASITAMSCCLKRCFQQSNLSQSVVYSQKNMLLTVKLVIFCFLWFPKVR